MPQTRELVGLADNGFRNHAGAQAAGAHGNRADFAVGELVTPVLKVGVEHTLGLDVGMAHIVAGLGLLPQNSHCLDMTSSIYSDGRPKKSF